jgi:integrase
MATLRKRKSGQGYIYHVDFRVKGRRYRVSTKTADRKIALQVLQDIQGKIARGTFNLLEYEKRDISLNDFLIDYFDQINGSKAASTIALEGHHTRRFVETVGNLNMRSIDIKILDLWKSKRLEEVRPVTFNIERRSMRAIFNVAKRWGYIDENLIPRVQKARVEEKRLFLRDDELARIFAAMDKEIASTNGEEERDVLIQFRLFVEFLLYTGLRREEGIKLRWSEIDLDHGVIAVVKSKDKKVRRVPLTRRGRQILQVLGPDLFSRLTMDFVTRKFGAYCVNEDLVGFKLHSLRHTFATKLIDAGVDVLTVSKLLGHSNINTTLIYAKVQLPVLERAVNMLERPLLQLTSGKAPPHVIERPSQRKSRHD